MRSTKWIINQKEPAFSDNILNIDEEIFSIIKTRHLNLEEELSLNPFDFSDIEIAVNRLMKAHKNKEKVWIYGDYDVDGITSVSLCYLALTELGFNIEYYIPLRDEGYGINNEALKSISEKDGKLIITVDCGISSVDEIAYANSLGLEVIITDHHVINNNLPEAFAVINTKREENIYDFKELAGVGVAYVLIYALFIKFKKESEIEKYLDIVTIGTIADIVPLVKDNRTIVKKGLSLLNKTKWKGLKFLISRVFDDFETREFTTYDVGYLIAPILNAAGRLEDAKIAVKLFIEEDTDKILKIIDVLLENNNERKLIQHDIFEESLAEIKKKKLYDNWVIIVSKENLHHGVIGIVASKVLEKYYKPTIIIDIQKEKNAGKASCRSIKNIDIVEALKEVSDLLISFGGHSGAAGFSIETKNIPEFSKRINDFFKRKYSKEDYIQEIEITNVLEPFKISYSMLSDMKYLEPFGSKNLPPIFAMFNCSFDRLRLIGKDKTHLMLDIISKDLKFINCVWFGGGEYFDEILKMSKLDIAFKLKLESYKGRFQYKIYIEDIKDSAKNIQTGYDYKNNFSIYNIIFPIETVIYTRRPNIEDKLSLSFLGNDINVIYNRYVIGTLDQATTFIIKSFMTYYNYKFKVRLKSQIKKDENYNVHIEIDRDLSFNSLAIKEGQLMTEIKNFLINDFSYNSIQKKILSAIFKDKKNTLAIIKQGRGIKTIIRTIELFYSHYQKRVYIVLDQTKFLPGYDFYIFLNNIDIPKDVKNALVISDVNLDIKDFYKIVDSYDIPKNIKILDENNFQEREIKNGKDIIAPNNYSEKFYSKKLPHNLKKKLIVNIDKYHEVIATKDIIIHF